MYIDRWAMFKLGAKNSFLLCLLVKNMPAVYSADRCNFESWNWLFQELKQSLQELSWKSAQFWTIWPFQICKSSLQLADLGQSLNLCYRFILLDENNSRIRKSSPNLNIALWGLRGRIYESLVKRLYRFKLQKNPISKSYYFATDKICNNDHIC